MITLDEAATAPVEQVGGKARVLAQAHRRGMPVPAGVVVGPSEEPSAAEVQAALGTGPYAVRSSSPVEDGEARSWAGQFTSRLPVEGNQLVAAIGEVRASGSSARALAYGSAGEPIPVLVQPLIDAVCAGMAFTLDPSSGDERYCIVEAVSGLGIDLADGQTTPGRWRVEIETGRATGDADGRLSPAALQGVVALALEVAEWWGRPIDIEWAWDGRALSLLQARPLTAASWHPAPGLWTSANLSETMPGIVSPMAASIILEDEFGRSIDTAAHRLRLAPDQQRLVEGRRFYGHAFWRVDRIKDRVLRLPGMVERKIDESMGIAPTYPGDGRRSGFTPAAVARALPVAHAMWGMFRHDGPRAQRFAVALAASEAQWLAVDWDALAPPALGEHLAVLRELHRQTNQYAIGITFLAEQAHDFVRELLEVAGSSTDPPPNAPLLLAGLAGESIAAATAELERAARECGDDAAAILAAGNAAELPEAVAQGFHAAVASPLGRGGEHAVRVVQGGSPRASEQQGARRARPAPADQRGAARAGGHGCHPPGARADATARAPVSGAAGGAAGQRRPCQPPPTPRPASARPDMDRRRGARHSARHLLADCL